MTDRAVHDVIDRLAELVQSGQLPSRARPVAERLMERLSSPIRVSVLGSDLAKAAAFQTTLEAASAAAYGAPNFCLVGPSADTADPAQSSEMTIWVTDGVSDSDLAAWRHVPDHLRNHAFLVIDTSASSARPQTYQRHKLRGHGFAAVFLIDLSQDMMSTGLLRLDPCEIDHLLEALHDHVETGCQADLDGALMFMRRFSGQDTRRPHSRPINGPRAFGRTPGSTPRPVTRITRSAVTEEPPETPHADIAVARRSATPAVPDATAPVYALSRNQARDLTAAAAATPPSPSVDPAIWEDAVRLIQTRADDLQNAMHSAQEQDADAAARALSDLVTDLAERLSDVPDATRLITQAQDLLVLLSLENSEDAVVDTACVVLQLKRSFEAARAA